MENVDQPGQTHGTNHINQQEKQAMGDEAEPKTTGTDTTTGTDASNEAAPGSLRRKVGHPRGIMLYGLKAARIEAELYANELSERSGVHKNTVYRLENEVSGAGPVTIRKLCRALGVEPETLRRPPDKSPY